VFVPDYLANAGGVIDFHQETIDDQPAAVLASVARIGCAAPHDTTIPRLGCCIVCGGANNQLAEALHDVALAVRGIADG
jgi:hypothetical protein